MCSTALQIYEMIDPQARPKVGVAGKRDISVILPEEYFISPYEISIRRRHVDVLTFGTAFTRRGLQFNAFLSINSREIALLTHTILHEATRSPEAIPQMNYRNKSFTSPTLFPAPTNGAYAKRRCSIRCTQRARESITSNHSIPGDRAGSLDDTTADDREANFKLTPRPRKVPQPPEDEHSCAGTERTDVVRMEPDRRTTGFLRHHLRSAVLRHCRVSGSAEHDAQPQKIYTTRQIPPPSAPRASWPETVALLYLPNSPRASGWIFTRGFTRSRAGRVRRQLIRIAVRIFRDPKGARESNRQVDS